MADEEIITTPTGRVIDVTDRLFVPLKGEFYRAFESGAKTWELRGVNDQFNPDTVRVGRSVELRRGYSTDDSLWGVVTAVRTFETPDEIIETFPYEQIRPGADPAELRDSIATLLGKYDEFIAFEVTLVDTTE